VTTAAGRHVIREARPEEFAALGELIVAAYHDVGETEEGYFDELRDVASRATFVPVLVAVDPETNDLLGGVTYVPGPGPFHEGDFGDSASLRMLAVAPDARRLGIGRALVEACIARARADGRAAIGLYTRPLMTAAHDMYESLGFRRVTELDWEFEPGEWLFAYRLDL
jgi:ribosomal protein S18 acetylase RimI-like enzyme